MKKLILILCLVSFIATATASELTGVVVGADRDAHGCIGSAGYSWSSPLKKCIRPWEYYTIKADAPIKTGLDRLDHRISDKANSITRGFKRDVEMMFGDLGESLDPSRYTLDIHYNLLQTGSIVSVKMDVYTYVGGAHGTAVVYTWNYDTQSRQFITLSKVLTKKQLKKISENAERALVKYYNGEVDTQWLRQGLSPRRLSNYQIFSLETDVNGKSKNILFYMADYQIGAHVLGMPVLHVDLSTLDVTVEL